jgi:ABC-2 type transport system permease protein
MTPSSATRDRAGRGALTGTARLIRLAARRDRVLLPVWVAVIVGLVVASVASIVGLYAGEADRLRYATVAAASAVARAFDGPMSGTSLGAITMTETFGFLAVLVGIMSVQAVTRHTRQEEETGRAELVGSAVVGHHAPLVAALIVTAVTNLVLAGAVTLTLVAHGLPGTGSVAAGAALAGVGVTFAAVAAVAAQVASNQRVANGLGTAAVGIAFLLRAVGDAFGTVASSGVEVVSAWPSWISPIGWGQQMRPYAGERWFVIGLFAGAAVLLVALAFLLRSHRDVGAGLLAVRRGPPTASAMLRSPLGLSWRLQRGVVLGWASGLGVLAAAFGAIGEEAGDLIATSDELAAMLAQLGEAGLVDLYFSFFMGILGVAAAGFTVQTLLRARNEELGGRAEPVLATAVSRPRWLLSHVAVAALGTIGILTLAGLLAGVSYAVVTGGGEQVRPLLAAGLIQAPAALALGGFVVATIGLLARWAVAIGWGALVASLVMGQLGALLELPQAVLNLSPFTHVPALPAEELAWLPVFVLLGVAVALTALGAGAFRRRDLATT